MTTLSNSGSNFSAGCCDDQTIGAKPANVKWNVVRGDTATIMIQFLQNDEKTSYDTTDWTYVAKAYDSKTDTTYSLDTEVIGSSVKITAPSTMTSQWGTAPKDKVAELSFDLQVTLGDNTVWTPVLGTIGVIGDVPGVLV